MAGQIRRCSLALAFIAFSMVPGCLSFLNPAPPPLDETREMCRQFPADCRAGVCVFLVNGCDPFECANLRGVGEYLGKLGFVKTYFGQIYHADAMLDEIHRLRASNPEWRFIVVGYEYGAGTARHVAQVAANDGANIDILLLLEPKCLTRLVPPDQSVSRYVVVRAGSIWGADAPVDDAESMNLSKVSRFGVPTHPAVLELIADVAVQSAQMVPIRQMKIEAFPQILDDPAPSPRPLVRRPPHSSDAWDFLKPVSRQRLRSSEPVELLPMPRVKK
jgi:hypothetical protein